ncbi:MAG: Crp/Fnr family transcriptional regulator [Rhodobacteraceae bacterium]|nr:Crp/Fnr family transcriptional regulator [Paracoccaceae bacterium]
MAEPGKLDEGLNAVLRRHARQRVLTRGEALYGRGSPPDALFCVERGIIRLSVTSHAGREAVLGLVTAGHWFGEASLFTRGPRGNDAIAVVESAVLIVPAATLHALIDDRPDYLRQFLAMMGQRYKTVISRMDDTVLLPLPARLARLIVQMVDAGGEAGDRLVLHFSQEEAAHMLGASRQSINRVLKRWEAAGIVQLGYRTLALEDLSTMRRLCRA